MAMEGRNEKANRLSIFRNDDVTVFKKFTVIRRIIRSEKKRPSIGATSKTTRAFAEDSVRRRMRWRRNQ
jgi:hypothetical protein